MIPLIITLTVSLPIVAAGGVAMYWMGRLDERNRWRNTPTAEPLVLPGAVRDHSRPARQRLHGVKPGPRTPIAEVMRHPAAELPPAQRIEDATTVVLRRDETAVLPAIRTGRH